MATSELLPWDAKNPRVWGIESFQGFLGGGISFTHSISLPLPALLMVPNA